MRKIILSEAQLNYLFAQWGAPSRKTPNLNKEDWDFFVLFENGLIFQAKEGQLDKEPITEISAIDLIEEMKELKFEWQGSNTEI